MKIISSTFRFYKIFLGIIIASFFLIPIAQAQNFTAGDVCAWLNNQSQTDTTGLPASTQFNNYFFVITEEKLTPSDNKNFSFDCYRKIDCAVPTGQTTTGSTAPSLRKCTPTYTEKCDPSDPAKIKEQILQKSTDGTLAPYTICEPIQVLISQAGTNMLYTYIGQLYTYAVGLGAILSVLLFIVGGLMWSVSGNNANLRSQAMKLITANLMGLAVLLLSALILYTINPNFFVK